MRKLIFILSILWVINCHAQSPSYIQFKTEDGLPSNEVYGLEIDSSGLLWITTDRGVCTYDGSEFVTYTTKDGLADNTNFGIFKDRQERLWFNGFNGELSYFEGGIFKQYAHNDSLRGYLSEVGNSWIQSMGQKTDGTYVLTKHRDFKGRHIEFKLLEEPKVLYNDQKSEAQKEFEDDKIVIYRLEEHLLINEDIDVFFKALKKGKLLARYRGRIFLADESVHFTFSNNRLYFTDSRGETRLIKEFDAIITCIFQDGENRIFLATTKGLIEYNFLEDTQKIHFKNSHITDIQKDKNGSLWISTLESGVYLIPNFDIRVWNTDNPKERYLSIASIKDYVFVGSSDGYVYQLNKSLEYSILTRMIKRGSAQVRFLEHDPEKDELYVPNGLNFRVTESGIKKIEGYQQPILLKFLSNGDSIVYTSTFFKINTIKGKNSFYIPAVKASEGINKRIWIASRDGLFTIDNFDYSHLNEITLENGQSVGRVSDFWIDEENIWVSTLGQGLYYITADTINHWTTVDGLNSDLINDIHAENDSVILMASNSGLSRLHFSIKGNQAKLRKIQNINSRHGLSSDYITGVTVMDSMIWASTNSGVSYFETRIMDKSYELNNVDIDLLSVGKDRFNDLDKTITLKPNQNDLRIEFSSNSFLRDATNPLYRLRINDVSSQEKINWEYSNDPFYSTYNLPSGEYTFEVQARNIDGVWSPSAVQKFIIEKPFVETFWFKLLMLLLLNAIVLAIIFEVRRRTKLKADLENAELKIREAELSALRNQMNPHFIFNALNSIQNFIFKKDVLKANYYLSKFSRLIRNSLQYSRLNYIPLEDELEFLKSYIELESLRFDENFEFIIDIDEKIPTKSILIPSLLLQPVLENSVKHAFMNITKKGILKMEISSVDDEHVFIKITDNGPGIKFGKIKTTTDHDSLGLNIIKNRINLLNESNKNGSSSVKIQNLTEGDDIIGLEVLFVLQTAN